MHLQIQVLSFHCGKQLITHQTNCQKDGFFSVFLFAASFSFKYCCEKFYQVVAKNQKISLNQLHSMFSCPDAQGGEVTGSRSQGSEANATVSPHLSPPMSWALALSLECVFSPKFPTTPSLLWSCLLIRRILFPQILRTKVFLNMKC